MDGQRLGSVRMASRSWDVRPAILANDHCPWPQTLEFVRARVGDLRFLQTQAVEPQTAQMHEPRIGDMSAVQIQIHQVRQSGEMHEPFVGNRVASRYKSLRFVSPARCASPASVI